MNKREARASALDYVVRVVNTQGSIDAIASYLGLKEPWVGEGTHPDVDLLSDAVDDVLAELSRALHRLKTKPVRGSLR
ncbi:hypothetical protein [Actinomadura luteofluorescens]|uniref:hypothetical protein n=1 Tax=Actinomadura luteofluorescens TaxID=46163 RepID=UPI003D8F896E